MDEYRQGFLSGQEELFVTLTGYLSQQYLKLLMLAFDGSAISGFHDEG